VRVVRAGLIVAGTAATLALAACSGTPIGDQGYEVKLGYFPNLTHAPAIIAIEHGMIEDALAEAGARLTTQTFNSGSDTIKALLGGGLDATYIGPSPAVTAFVQSNGEGVRVVSGATAGGAALVVQPEIEGLDDLVGLKVATPGLGNTQDIALRSYLAGHGYATDPDGGGDIAVVPQNNGTTVQTFRSGEIAGAWVPEPYLSLLVESGGKVLVDEADLWPGGQFVTTQLIVRTEFLQQHPALVRAIVHGNVDAIRYIEDNPEAARDEVAAELAELTGASIDPAVTVSAWARLAFTVDPLSASLVKGAQDAAALGLLNGDISGIGRLYDLGTLNAILGEEGLPTVTVE